MGNCSSDRDKLLQEATQQHSEDRFAPSGYTPLTAATQGNYQDAVDYILQAGATVNTKDKMGNAPLHLAVRHGYEDIFKLFVADKSCDVNVTDRLGMTPLHIACMMQREAMVVTLLDAGANPNGTDDANTIQTRAPPLHLSIDNGTLDISLRLLQAGASPNARDCWENTAVIKAAQKNDIETMKYLLDQGASATDDNKFGLSALSYAIYGHHCDLLTFILGYLGKEAFVKHVLSEVDFSPLTIAIHRNCLHCFRLFLDLGLDMDDKDKYGRTALHYAFTQRTWSCFGEHHSAPLCTYSRVTDRMDAERIGFADLLIKRGADMEPVWNSLVWLVREANLITDQEPLVVRCIQAFGFRDFASIKIQALFRNCVLKSLFKAAFSLYLAGYDLAPDEHKLVHERLTRLFAGADPDQTIALPEHGARYWGQLLKHYTTNKPRSLQSMCVVAVRKSISQNVLHLVPQLVLPSKLSDMVTLTDFDPR